MPKNENENTAPDYTAIVDEAWNGRDIVAEANKERMAAHQARMDRYNAETAAIEAAQAKLNELAADARQKNQDAQREIDNAFVEQVGVHAANALGVYEDHSRPRRRR